jgi:hypothetical protein
MSDHKPTANIATARATDLADGLRNLAQFINDHPDLADAFAGGGLTICVPLSHKNNPPAEIAQFARAGVRAGRRVTKSLDGEQWGGVKVHFGRRVTLDAYAHREQVCERVVVGTETVTKQVPDPEALAAVPTVEITETVEQVQWRCSPLLAAEPAAAPIADLGDVLRGALTPPTADSSTGSRS